jgi:hypothetical protein
MYRIQADRDVQRLLGAMDGVYICSEKHYRGCGGSGLRIAGAGLIILSSQHTKVKL